ncbi:MAG: type II toxin-antitoxin system prevent-host-death family antitoxin [SAR324 cluster bacterium]|nr:type II toxin-antitoxin system prevent-host-death family antitoxin [SAR324 cluster bacterium]
MDLAINVAVPQHKANLSRLLARGQSGEVIEVTSHREPITHIVGVPEPTGVPLDSLRSSGALSWNGKKPVFEEPLALTDTGKSPSSLILEDRR